MNLIRRFVYVGTIDAQKSLIQFETELYLTDTRHLSQELFYQLFIYHFGNMGTIQLEPEAPLVEVRSYAVSLALNVVSSRSGFDPTRN